MRCLRAIIGLLVFILVGCSNVDSASVSLPTGWQKFCDQDFDYCIGLPSAFGGSGWQESIGNSGVKVEHIASNGVPFDSPQSVILEVYHTSPFLPPPPILPPPPACSYLGISKPKVIKNEDEIIVLGKVDELYDGSTRPHCYTHNIFGEQMSSYTSSYVLCSEKNDKKVMICIQQVTDDPVLANSILDTFRWTPQSLL